MHYICYVFGEKPEEQLAPFTEEDIDGLDKSVLEFEEDENGPPAPGTEKRGWWTNPKAKWDWYELGGRWKNMFSLKTKEATDEEGIRLGYGMSQPKTDQDYLKNLWLDLIESPVAYLYKGKWIHDGPLFGRGEERQAVWFEIDFKTFLLSLPEDTLISNYDLHD